jgi:hypothetical protein
MFSAPRYTRRLFLCPIRSRCMSMEKNTECPYCGSSRVEMVYIAGSMSEYRCNDPVHSGRNNGNPGHHSGIRAFVVIRSSGGIREIEKAAQTRT